MKRITNLKIENLKASEARREFPLGHGLYCVVQPSGRKSFAYRYRSPTNGAHRKLTFKGGLTLAAARKLASDATLEIEHGRDPADLKKETKAKAIQARA